MKQYLDLMRRVLDEGVPQDDRTGVGTLSVFGHQMRFNLADGFPLVTTKKIHMKSVIHELIWFLSGDTNIEYLNNHGVHIWDKWADKNGNLGPVYGRQWRSWPSSDMGDTLIDQIKMLIHGLRTNPASRRHIVTAWNPGELDKMSLPPCHCLFQFNVTPPPKDTPGARGKLNCQLYQRSGDVFLGVPFNIASYALLTHMVAQVVGLEPGEFIHTLGDAHLYRNHLEQTSLQLTRTPRSLPKLTLDSSVKNIDDFGYTHVTITGYDPHDGIKASVAV